MQNLNRIIGILSLSFFTLSCKYIPVKDKIKDNNQYSFNNFGIISETHSHLEESKLFDIDNDSGLDKVVQITDVDQKIITYENNLSFDKSVKILNKRLYFN